jgi:hypothetical protein
MPFPKALAGLPISSSSLNELENARLIMRVRQRGFAEPNRIYILIPKI